MATKLKNYLFTFCFFLLTHVLFASSNSNLLPLVANNDALTSFNGINGQNSILNVLDNDLLNGIIPTTTNVILTELNYNSSNQITLDSNGFINILANSLPGVYTIQYQICETALPTNCQTASVTITIQSSQLQLTALLQGALIYSSNGLMRDDLRVNNVIPLTEPYFQIAQNGNLFFVRPDFISSETTTNTVLSVSGNNAIVDWVFIELRDPSNYNTILHTKCALIQRNGSVVESTDGVSPLSFSNMTKSSYYIAIKHRNHLGIMTASPIGFNQATVSFDFSNATSSSIWNSQPMYDGNEQILNPNGTYALWGGNTNLDNKIKYAGTNNDTSFIFYEIINYANNYSDNYSYNLFTPFYSNADTNMDAKIKYMGASNDLSIIFYNTVNYPLNTNLLYLYNLFLQQIPE